MCVWFFGTVTLLNIPGFIERLCKLATRKVSEATGANFQQELEDWYTWLDNALVLDALMQMATEETEQSSTGETSDNRPEIENWRTLSWGLLFFFQLPESSDESSLASSPLRHRLPQSMKIVHEIMYKVEVLYVLCVLLMGRQRNQVLFHNQFFFFPSGFKLECRYLPELSAPLLPVCCYCRSTRCWLSSGSSQASTTYLTSSSGGSTPLLTTWCTARMRTATVVRYEPLTQCCSCRLTLGI